ncbi:uncharacterized protein LOC116172238 [Photinus pyralis]|uniref:uncharacterized protein LOC116172238 n=1 Tax=Photinus pyralis TaxID=7054 RepID=UPI001267298D|nr:uncharacterized protein LOC116172238 [Photinus pyralis]
MHTKVSHVVADADVQEGNLDKERIRPRKGRKRKHANVSRSGNKENRNSNRDYFNYKGKKIQAKTFIDFDCKCTMKCHDNVSLEIRKIEFERFWSLKSYDSQVTFIAAGVQQFPKKRLYGRDPDKRQFSRRYNIHGQIVCKSIYLKTLGITSFRVHTALKKFRGVIPITDQRGQKQGGYNKLADDKVQKVVDQINRIPKYTSHYRREATTAQFLPPDVTIQKMFEMYRLETENPVRFSSYKKIFYERFNLKFKSLKKDTCNTCDTLNMKATNEANLNKQQEIKKQHENHLENAEGAQKLRRQDFKLAKENDEYECLTFDL